MAPRIKSKNEAKEVAVNEKSDMKLRMHQYRYSKKPQ